MLARIRAQAEEARQGRSARILAKMNALVEAEAIEALYRASQAGVAVDLVVRGICCLRPGVAGMSERIRVRSVIGRFLEHDRAFCFENERGIEVLCSSGDWMERNFFHRIEVCFPVSDPSMQRRIAANLELAMRDNCQAWSMQSDGSYRRLSPANGQAISCQQSLLERLAEFT
jgi:polyphosphate kinase